jgi:hypothetical protein
VIAMTSAVLICIFMHSHMKLKNIHDNASVITWKFWKKYVDSFIILGKVRTIKHLSIYYPLEKKNLADHLVDGVLQASRSLQVTKRFGK